MRKLFLPLTVVLFVGACGPRDVPLDREGRPLGGKGGGASAQSNKSQAFVLEKDGERSNTCPEDFSDHKTLVVPQEDVDQILTGEIRAVVDPGNRNCFRIGATVQIRLSKDDKSSLGEAVIQKTEALRLSALGKKHADLFAMSVGDLEDRGQRLIDAAKFDAAGMVTLTYFKVKGDSEDENSTSESSPNEAKPSPQEKPLASLLIFDTLGERSTSCNPKSKDWKDLLIPADQDVAIRQGEVLGWATGGPMNCFRIGSLVNLTDQKGGVSRGQLRVTMVQVFPLAKLNITHSLAMNLPFLNLKEKITSEVEAQAFNDQKIVNMTFFEWVDAP